MKRLALLASVVLAIASVAFAQDNRHDGNWWNTLSPASQVDYAVGFFDGIELGKYFAQPILQSGSGASANQERLREFDAIEKRARERAAKYVDKVTMGQVVDGLNEFYRDFRNRSIRVFLAIDVVLRQINGEKVDAMIESLRRL